MLKKKEQEKKSSYFPRSLRRCEKITGDKTPEKTILKTPNTKFLPTSWSNILDVKLIVHQQIRLFQNNKYVLLER